MPLHAWVSWALASGGSGSVEAVSGPGSAGTSTFVGSEIAKSERPELTSAKIIVSGIGLVADLFNAVPELTGKL